MSLLYEMNADAANTVNIDAAVYFMTLDEKSCLRMMKTIPAIMPQKKIAEMARSLTLMPISS